MSYGELRVTNKDGRMITVRYNLDDAEAERTQDEIIRSALIREPLTVCVHLGPIEMGETLAFQGKGR